MGFSTSSGGLYEIFKNSIFSQDPMLVRDSPLPSRLWVRWGGWRYRWRKHPADSGACLHAESSIPDCHAGAIRFLHCFRNRNAPSHLPVVEEWRPDSRNHRIGACHSCDDQNRQWSVVHGHSSEFCRKCHLASSDPECPMDAFNPGATTILDGSGRTDGDIFCFCGCKPHSQLPMATKWPESFRIYFHAVDGPDGWGGRQSGPLHSSGQQCAG